METAKPTGWQRAWQQQGQRAGSGHCNSKANGLATGCLRAKKLSIRRVCFVDCYVVYWVQVLIFRMSLSACLCRDVFVGTIMFLIGFKGIDHGYSSYLLHFTRELSMKAFINGIILDGTKNMSPITGKSILVDGDRIKDIVDSNSNPEGCEIVDLNGKYIMPGLINMHVHIPANGKPKNKPTNYDLLGKLLKFGIVRKIVFNMCENYIKDEVFSGTTTVRAVGGVFHFDSKLRDKINAGKAVGPRIIACNYAVSVPGGHMTGTVALPAHSVDEAVAMVQDLHDNGADWIKLMITGGVLDAEVPGEPGVLKMPAEYVKAACGKAHELGHKVAAHVEGSEGMQIALENGVDTIEHGGKPNERTAELFKEKGAALVATISPALPFSVMDHAVSHIDEIGLVNGKALFNHMIECINTCRANGIPVGLGTDVGCPFTTHYDMWRELYWYNKIIGVSAKECIYSATGLNASIAGIDNEVGTIEQGKSADFIILSKNPLEDLTILRSPDEVYFRGSKVKGRPKKFEDVERELDKLMQIYEAKAGNTDFDNK